MTDAAAAPRATSPAAPMEEEAHQKELEACFLGKQVRVAVRGKPGIDPKWVDVIQVKSSGNGRGKLFLLDGGEPFGSVDAERFSVGDGTVRDKPLQVRDTSTH